MGTGPGGQARQPISPLGQRQKQKQPGALGLTALGKAVPLAA
ncbi:MAG: hypothetical protein QF749_09380 [Verrucomicrobiota bacterium]|nr:hypothetical protein [Verrucomicrobiota bacterium]MDP7178491.1 hypothetical protein [Verrucomicrobiota bacterium]